MVTVRIPCKVSCWEGRTRRVFHPPCAALFNISGLRQTAFQSPTSVPLFLSFVPSKPYQMVPVTSRIMYLFLALFALPQVLAVPGVAALGLRSPSPDAPLPPIPTSIETEVIIAHNAIRGPHGAPPLTWNGGMALLARYYVSKCHATKPPEFGGMPSYCPSLFIGGTHV